MGEPVQTNGLITPPRPVIPASESLPRRMAMVALAGILCLAVLDLAIETFLTGLPVRWVVVGMLAGSIALGALLRRRLSAAVFAWGAAFAALGMLAVTAWMPNGTTAGVVVLSQPTSRVLAGVALCGVLFAAVCIIRATVVPLPAKAVVGLLALYGAWALVWGIILQTPYPALLHGESAWQRLPFWLQGSFLAVALIIPAGLLATLIGAIVHGRQGGRPVHWIRQAIVLLLVATIACSGIAVQRGSYFTTGAMGSTGLTGPTGYAAPPSPLQANLYTRPASHEAAVAQLDRMMTIVRSLAALVDPASVLVGVRASRLGADIDGAFAFVRDSIAFEPYAGLLRGSRGTLIARAGNALDRSVLLAELLEAHGVDVRIAHGTLAENKAAELLARWSDTAVTAQSIPEDAVTRVVESAGEPQAVAAARRNGAHGREVWAWVQARAGADTAAIRSALGASGSWFKDTAAARVAEQLRSHFWVQAQVGEQWLDLDPSFPAATRGQRFAEPATSFAASAIPPDLVHSVNVSMTVRQGDEAPRVVLNKTFRACDLATEQLHLTNGPVGIADAAALSQAKTYRADLKMGTQVFHGTAYPVAGEPGNAMVDMGGALFGAEAPAGKHLAGAWLEIGLAGPGTPPRKERRTFFDRTNRQANEAPVPDDVVRQLLVRDYDILVMPFAHPAYLDGWQLAQFIVSNEALFRRSMDVSYGVAKPASLRVGPGAPRFSPTLAAFGAAVSSHISRTSGPARCVLQRPFVAMLKQALTVRQAPGGVEPVTGIEQGLDIVSTGAVPLGGNASQRMERGLAFGTFLTNLELAFVREQEFGGGQVSNASVATESASEKGRGLVAVRAGTSRQDATLPDAARNVVRATLAEDDIAVVPVPDRTGEPLTWWRVDPDSGVVLGVATSGEGQGLTENQVKAALIGVGTLICGAVATREADTAKMAIKIAFCVAIGGFGMASQLTVVATGSLAPFELGPGLFYWILAWVLAIGRGVSGI